MSNFDFDVAVIGAGSAGIRFARIAATFGAKVAIIEKQHLGGTCVNKGCVPKKFLNIAANFNHELPIYAGFGFETQTKFNWQTFMQSKNKDLFRLHNVYQGIMDKNNVSIIDGHASFLGSNSLRIENHGVISKITARYIVIATGIFPQIPQFPGVEHAITSDELFFLQEQPKSITIAGGGYIALELATILANLGTCVTLVYRGNKILKNFDDDMVSHLMDSLKHTIDFRLGVNITKIEKGTLKQKSLVAQLSDGSVVENEHVLLALGRVFKDAVNLSATKVSFNDKGFIAVNKNFATDDNNIFAIGDVTGYLTLTPVALAQGQQLANFLFNNSSYKEMNYNNVATSIFSIPQYASVGLSEKDAKQKGKVRIFETKFTPMKLSFSGEYSKTFIKMIVDANTDKVLGCHMIGTDAAEIVQMIAVAMNAGATKADFDATIGIHPTLAEELVTMREFRDT